MTAIFQLEFVVQQWKKVGIGAFCSDPSTVKKLSVDHRTQRSDEVNPAFHVRDRNQLLQQDGVGLGFRSLPELERKISSTIALRPSQTRPNRWKSQEGRGGAPCAGRNCIHRGARHESTLPPDGRATDPRDTDVTLHATW